MSTGNGDRRKIWRMSHADILFPVRFLIYSGQQQIETELINYHFRGACVRLMFHSSAPHTWINPMVDILVGHKIINQQVPIRIAWETISKDGRIGFEFASKLVTEEVRLAPRFRTHDHYAPSAHGIDPINPQRLIYAKVVELSRTGALLLLSLSNKHLLPGMCIKNSVINLPGGLSFPLELSIIHARESEIRGSFYLGVKFENPPPTLSQGIDAYVTALSPSRNVRARAELLKRKGFLSRELNTNLTFRIIETKQEYKDLLHLRYEAYKKHGKTRQDSSWQTQGEGLQNEGTLIGSFVGAQMIASMEIRFGDDPFPLRTELLLKGSPLNGIDYRRTVEINKLAVRVCAQGSDAVIGMVQKAHALIVARGTYDILVNATDALTPLYERIGFRKTGVVIPHPVVEGLTLNVLFAPHTLYLMGKRINPYVWDIIFQRNQDFLSEAGLAQKVRRGNSRKIRILFYKYLNLFLRNLNKYRSERKRRLHKLTEDEKPRDQSRKVAR